MNIPTAYSTQLCLRKASTKAWSKSPILQSLKMPCSAAANSQPSTTEPTPGTALDVVGLRQGRHVGGDEDCFISPQNEYRITLGYGISNFAAGKMGRHERGCVRFINARLNVTVRSACMKM